MRRVKAAGWIRGVSVSEQPQQSSRKDVYAAIMVRALPQNAGSLMLIRICLLSPG